MLAEVAALADSIDRGEPYSVGLKLMGYRDRVGIFELEVLSAVHRLRDNAYGVPVKAELEKHTKRSVSTGSLYVTLDRLEDKGLLRSWEGDPTPERGGRPKRFYKLTAPGVRALSEARVGLVSLWNLRPARVPI
jgi:PadR family transcriptional regulator PadR